MLHDPRGGVCIYTPRALSGVFTVVKMTSRIQSHALRMAMRPVVPGQSARLAQTARTQGGLTEPTELVETQLMA